MIKKNKIKKSVSVKPPSVLGLQHQFYGFYSSIESEAQSNQLLLQKDLERNTVMFWIKYKNWDKNINLIAFTLPSSDIGMVLQNCI